MSEDQSDSPKAINERIRKVVTDLLHANGVYELGNIGWLNENDADPEFVGHAMWQTDSLSFRTLDARIEAMQSKNAKFPELQSWERFLISTGGDFEGLIDAARLSIGLALFQHEAGDVARFGGDTLFQLHLIAALVTLGAASDRLRDVFVAATFHQETKKYEGGKWKKKGDRHRYDAPFREAVELLKQLSVALESSAKLPAIAADIFSFRKTRNAVVHDLATETGRLAHEIANQPRPPAYSEAMEWAYAEAIKSGAKIEEPHLMRIAEDMERPIRWYKLLIEASNHVFIIENRLRRKGRDGP